MEGEVQKDSLFLILVCSLASVTLASNVKPSVGTISGTVIDEAGQPVELALVSVELLDNRPRGTPVRYVETNKAGHYEIQGLVLGPHKIFAKKETAGYPDTSFAFYSEHKFSTVNLTQQNSSAVVNIRLGPKAGTLRLKLVDAVTGKLPSGTVTLRRAAHPEMFFSTSTDKPVLVPALTDVDLSISAPGYATWPATLDRKSQVFLQADEVRDIEIALVPQSSR
ncbi:MAG: hypothetical protein DMG61_11675 [Acidobacteria bacterium]|nr:MAG: hypothetical protein DMG61_11675 [Acidobacteriota bacterium]